MDHKMKKVLELFIIAPLLLFGIVMGFAFYFYSAAAGDVDAINTAITNMMPYILMINHTILFLLLVKFVQQSVISWSHIGMGFQEKIRLIVNSLIGIIAGVVLFATSYFVLTPGLTALGIDAGAFQPGPNFPIIPYMIETTLFAGIVEESIYRSYALTILEEHLGTNYAVFVSSIFFSLLHFGEGIGGIFNALIIGVLLGYLFVWRRNIATNAFAHGITNLIMNLLSIL